MSSTERQRKHRAALRDAGIPLNPTKPFVGVDGEGAGTDELGRQNYLLLRAGDRELFDNNVHLSTERCLAFLCSLPANAIYVGFAFNYDATMILRDLPPNKRKQLFLSDAEREASNNKSPYVYFRDFAIAYRPSQYLSVARLDGQKIVKRSTRIIYETFGFFQSSFLKTISTFKVGLDHLETIDRNKENRSNFTKMTAEIRKYNHIECILLAELMEKFRTLCHDGNIRPRTWNGAGKLASALHSAHKTVRTKILELPPGLMDVCKMAYYGGRFEITRTGLVNGPIYEYDLISAYPAAMQNVPCLIHGRWVRGFDPEADHSICKVRFEHGNSRHFNIMGLPIRTKAGVLTWPSQGIGVYWNVELKAAAKLGVSYTCQRKQGWTYHTDCGCKPFQWVQELFNYRRAIGKADRGIPIKYGINALYGKLAQRIGNGQWANHLWAGLITAQTRAWLMDAASQSPDDILMFATDGIYSKSPLDLNFGEGLGQWEMSGPHERMFIVQPGFYWGTTKPKRRGMPQKFFEPLAPTFEQVWNEFQFRIASTDKWPLNVRGMNDYPIVPVDMERFIGLRLANALGKPERAGVWEKIKRDISFEWTNKRRFVDYKLEGSAVHHFPILSGPVETQYYNWTADTETIARQLVMDMEANPDYMDFSQPFKD